MPGAARFDVLVPPPADGSTRARVGPPAARPRHRGDADLHAGRHERDRQGASPRRPRRGRRPDHPGQHLPPVPAPGARADRAPRRPQPLHGLGPADPHRLRRLPGRLPRRSQHDRRRRGHVPQPPRRLPAPLHARVLDRDPGGPRAGRRGRLRPAGPAVVEPTRATSRSRRSGRTAGRSAPWRPTGGPTRRSSGSSRGAWTRSCGGAPPRSSPACPSTASTSAASPATRRRPSAARSSTSSCRSSAATRGCAT